MDTSYMDRYLSKYFDSIGDTVSGLSLEGCGEDGHKLANKMWKISAYYKGLAIQREAAEREARSSS